MHETGAKSHKVNNLILFADNTAALHARKEGIFRAFNPTGNKDEELQKLSVLMRPFLSAVLVRYRHEFGNEEGEGWTKLTDAEKDEFCRLYAADYYSYDVQTAIAKDKETSSLDLSAAANGQRKSRVLGKLKAAPITVEILQGASVHGNVVKLNCGQIDRRTYALVDDALKAMGGKWSKKLGGHVFKEDPSGILDSFLESGEADLPERFDFFATQPPEVAVVIRMADLRPGMKVLEPEAGEGALAEAAAAVVGMENVFCVEIDPGRKSGLEARGFAVIGNDFMALQPRREYDRVVMNPPFSKLQDVKHVLHALAFLKEGGILTAIMGDGIRFRTDRLSAKLRGILKEYGTIEENRKGAFKDTGTMVNTIVVSLAVTPEVLVRLSHGNGNGLTDETVEEPAVALSPGP